MTRRQAAECLRVHELKIWPAPFREVVAGHKRHEFRRFDRDFREGDVLLLKEVDPKTLESTGRQTARTVVRVFRTDEYGAPGFAILEIAERP